jgi:uroporphyrinogen-III decarboxylase
MNPQTLKDRFGDRLTFWGGGVDTQRTLPFGTPQEIQAQVAERMRIFGKGGGFVWNSIHNIQASTPQENLVALYQAVAQYREL